MLYPFQGWPCDDIRPTEALMLLCSYENQTAKTIHPKQLEDGTLQLKDLLTEEDFAMAHSVRLLIRLPKYVVPPFGTSPISRSQQYP